MVNQGQTESFITALTELGGPAGSGRLHEALQWNEAASSNAEDEPIAIVPGRLPDALTRRINRSGHCVPHRS